MEIGTRPVNPTVVQCIPDQHGGHPGGTRRLHVQGRVSEVPYRPVRGPAQPVESKYDRGRVRLVGGRVAGADDRAALQAWVDAQSVADPEKLARVIAPGF